MTIQEAILSGRPFRRIGKTTWKIRGQLGSPGGHCNTLKGWISPDFFFDSCVFTAEDILATDWEIEDKRVTITSLDFEMAVSRALNGQREYDFPVSRLRKELGL